MPYFAIHAIDRAGNLPRRLEARADHRARLRDHDHPVTVRIAGPLLDAAGAMTGTLLIVEAADRAAAQAFFDGDPYSVAGIFERIEIREFAWGLTRIEAAPGG